MVAAPSQPILRVSASGPIVRYALSDYGKALMVLATGLVAPALPFNTVAEVVYYTTGNDDQSALNALMAAEAVGMRRSVHVLPGTSSNFDCDIDAVIPSNTTLVYASDITITGTGRPLMIGGVQTVALGTLAAPNTARSNVFSCSVAIDVGTVIGLQLTSGSANNDALSRYLGRVIDCTGVGPYTVTLDREIPVSLPTADVVRVASNQTNVNIFGCNCQVQTTAPHVYMLYAQNCVIDSFVGSAAPGNNELIGCSGCTVSNFTDQATLMFAASTRCNSLNCRTSNVSGPAFVIDDCVDCEHVNARAIQCLNGGIMGTNLLSAAGADGGSLRCKYSHCVAIKSSGGGGGDGFSVQNTCVECEIADCASLGCSAAAVRVTAGWAGVGPKLTKITNHCSRLNGNHIVLGSDGSTKATGTVIDNPNFVGTSIRTTIAHTCTMQRGEHEGAIQIQAGTFDCTIQNMARVESAEWAIGCDGNTVGTIVVRNVSNVKTAANATAALLLGSAVKVILEDTNLNSTGAAGIALVFGGAGATIRFKGKVGLNGASAIAGAAGNYLGRHEVTLVGGTTGAIAWPDLNNIDRINVDLKAAGGTLGAHYAVVPNPGIGFSVNSLSSAGALVATDTSTLLYSID